MFASNKISARAAFGRIYKNQKQIRADYKSNLDFIDVDSGKPINKEDLENLGYVWLDVRYKNDTEVCVIDVLKSQ